MGYDDSITMLHEIIPNRLSKKIITNYVNIERMIIIVNHLI
jgi:hypothetical protein